MTKEEIETMLAECESDITEVEKTIRRLKRQGRFAEIHQWKAMLYDLKRNAGELKSILEGK